LRTLAKHAVREQYLQDVSEGKLSPVVVAVETALEAFPVVSEQVREEARHLRIARSPLAPRIAGGAKALELRDLQIQHVRRGIQSLKPPKTW
jgi:hypothetical protein